MKFLASALATFLILVGCVTVSINASQSAAPETFTWSGDVAKLNVTALDGNGSCSGWMITETELATAGHCVEQLISMTACFYPDIDCEKPVALTLIGADHTLDVAILKLPEGQTRRPVQMRGDRLAVGERVYAVGWPEGDFAVTDGLYARVRPSEALWDDVRVGWLQSSTPTAPGSSGGALYDAQGRLVGMTIGAQTFGPGIIFLFSIASPADVIGRAYAAIKAAPPAPPTIGVIGPATITRIQ